jgi:hypothetical protein
VSSHHNFTYDRSLTRSLVAHPLLVSFSATPTVTSSDRRPSLPQRASIRALLSMQGRRPSLLLAISSLFRHVLKVPLFATSRRNLVIVVHSLVLLATMPPSSVTPLTRTRPAFDSRQAQRRPSPAVRAPPLASLPVVDVLTSHCSRLAGHITNTRPNVTSTIHM